MLDQRIPLKPLPRGADVAWDIGVGLAGRFVPRYKKIISRVEKVLALEDDFSRMTDASLRDTAAELRVLFRCRRDRPADLERTFALVREVAVRQIGEKPFPVQVAGAFALEAGCIAEMATGEGKTLACTMPATVFGWRGLGCHVVTVNDYLAKRDADWMGKIYRFCGLTVSHIEQAMQSADRRRAYLADVTYCTNKEVSADFLRDRLTLGTVKGLGSALLEKITNSGRQVTDRLVQRGLYCAIVDEADSVLVDEAVTPLIISGQAPNPEQVKAFVQAAEIAGKLEHSADYNIDFRYREIELTDRGRQCIAELTKDFGGLWKGVRRREEMVIEALTASQLYLRDKQYVIEDDKVVIVDEFTGRLMPDRHWRDGMHQAIEAKEAVTINPPKDTYARISFQRFFRMYRNLAGMTGTAAEARNEFWQIYHLPVVVIPTNRPCIRKYLPEVVLTTEQAKWARIVQEIAAVHSTDRPILVGTRSVRASEHLSGLLSEQNLEHQVLNAIYHRQEAQIVAQAGQPGRITVATNMAGRGTDIKLASSVAELGGLHVIATERHESARVDRQLFGRCARQGDPGTARAIVSLEDELIYRYTGHFGGLLKKRITAEPHQDVSSKLTAGLFRLAQNRSERIALRQRKSVLQTDHWLDEQLGFAGAE
jgi:preprotein translocase subunit SecA